MPKPHEPKNQSYIRGSQPKVETLAPRECWGVCRGTLVGHQK